MTREKVKPVHIDYIELEGTMLELLIDEHHTPAAKCGDQVYHGLADLIKNMPELTEPAHLNALAEICNFVFKGQEFHFIKDVEEFKKMYCERIEFEKAKLAPDLQRLSDFGIFDVSVMHPPRIVKHQFIFFVSNDYNQLPFRVLCELPFSREYPSVRYELLPYVHGH